MLILLITAQRKALRKESDSYYLDDYGNFPPVTTAFITC
ncbi:hypothetical protein ECBCE006MS23_4851 [Escherichia coli BCE006_MS-23]|nr:hypothetical protein ECDEC1D_0272 [Escherichia coli DEC1D]EMV34037.1 hypothetical protein ECBCE019MS13_4826 [Escherichia coli BCE019_MS-13]ENA26721.1 hypothetical protein ECBCE007MS11_4908 [Escherichia coli BCE007_MS-11]ENB23837.1 hypothetical protein ECBCE030MS09_4824 [Escherichia coli BCE030_MS-09]ENB29216.1 hypothetical protein ECBCE032MS12_4783 [Escherichia coli BCE032_MS-12]END52463.1 hypothetical protein ECBCE006MS23_4851 [Escherichia coli BCE006_MS-23]KDT90313.1 hypothetical protein